VKTFGWQLMVACGMARSGRHPQSLKFPGYHSSYWSVSPVSIRFRFDENASMLMELSVGHEIIRSRIDKATVKAETNG
jgi:hypothetical protein